MKNTAYLLLLSALLTAGCTEISISVEPTPNPTPTLISYFITVRPSTEFKRLQLNLDALEARTSSGNATMTSPIAISAQGLELVANGSQPVFLGTAPMEADFIKSFGFSLSGYVLEARDSIVVLSDEPLLNQPTVIADMTLNGSTRRINFTLDIDASVVRFSDATVLAPLIRASID